MKILLEIYLSIGSLLYTLKTIRRVHTSANAQGYNNSLDILITTDRIFIKIFIRDRSRAKKVLIIFWKSSMERIPPPNTSNGTPITTNHIFMKVLPEMYQCQGSHHYIFEHIHREQTSTQTS